MRLPVLGLVLLVVPSLHAQLSSGQIDPTRCISDILRSTTTLNTEREAASKWLDLVDDEYYRQHKTDVDAAVTTAGWKATADFHDLDTERKAFHRNQESQSNIFEKIQYYFNGMSDKALETVERCFDRVAGDRPGIYFSILKNTDTEVILRLNWSKLPGPSPSPFIVTGSSLVGGDREGTDYSLLSRYNPFTSVRWEDEPKANELFWPNLKLSGTSARILRIRRDKPNESITATLSGPNFDEVFIEVPALQATHYASVNHCEVKAQQRSNGASHLSLAFPPANSQLLMLDCSGLPSSKKFVVTWQGTLLAPDYPSYSNGQPTDVSDPNVNYYVNLYLSVRDAAGQEIGDGSRQLVVGTRPAKENRLASGSTGSIPVPSNGEVLLYFVVFDSNKWPAALGPVSISNDFRLMIDTTAE